MRHPYAELIGFRITEQAAGSSILELDVREDLLNPHRVVHGAALFSLADTGMGAALYPMLEDGESCATINCGINYFRGVREGLITCTTIVKNKGRNVATLDSELWNADRLVATAQGQFSIFRRRE